MREGLIQASTGYRRFGFGLRIVVDLNSMNES
jgi:hypothetical protein